MERLTIDEVIEHCRKTCERAELVAQLRDAEIISKQYWEHYQVEEWLKELKEYQRLEEQGLLLKLPCPIGTTVYVIVEEWEEIYDSNSMYYDIYEEEFHPYMLEGVGKEVFLTEQEAQSALEKMKGE